MFRKLFVTALFASAVAASLGAYYLRHGGEEVAVSTATVSVGDVVVSVSATGSLEAVTTVEVGSQVSGTIAALHADFNSIVRAGQLLAEIDPSLLRAQTEQARASTLSAEAAVERLRVTLADARVTADRTVRLHARQLATTSELDAASVAVRLAEAQLRSGEAQLTQVKASLRQCEVNEQHARIYSPIEGIVISRSVDVGQTVAASMQAPTLFTLAADLSRLRLKASVGEADVGQVREGQVVRFRVDAYPGESFSGSVTQIRLQPTTSQNVVTYTAMIDVPNPEFRLRPGMTATTTIEIARRDQVTRVPNTALRFRPTAAMFAALGQPQPVAAARRAGITPGPPPAATTRPAIVWAWAEGHLQAVSIATGVSDGSYTEVVRDAPADTVQLVTSLAVPTTARSASVASPLMQQNGPPPGMPPPPPPGAGGGPPR
jgi:HlyD family secretion protein